MPVAVKSSPGKDGGIAGVDEEGVSLGTMKLPSDTDISRFETLLFQVILFFDYKCSFIRLLIPSSIVL